MHSALRNVVKVATFKVKDMAEFFNDKLPKAGLMQTTPAAISAGAITSS
jgi:hypothetical protein